MAKYYPNKPEEHRHGWIAGVSMGHYITLTLALLGAAVAWGASNSTISANTKGIEETKKEVSQIRTEIKESESRTKESINRSELRTREDIRELRDLFIKTYKLNGQ